MDRKTEMLIGILLDKITELENDKYMLKYEIASLKDRIASNEGGEKNA